MFEYDEKKSASNLEKHGIDFNTAQALWRDPDRLSVPVDTFDEPRYLLIAMLKGKCWTAVYTLRGEITRLISVRRSRKKEVCIYES